MDGLKKQRTVLRTAFTRANTSFTTIIGDEAAEKDDKIVAFQLLEAKMAELDTVQSQYSEALLQNGATEAEIGKELEGDDTYKTNYLKAKLRIEKLITPAASPTAATTASADIRIPSTAHQTSANTKKNLPKLGIPTFHGSVREWLPFWSQFKKYHEDNTLSKEEKFEYLLQATVSESRARSIVESFPPTSENYDKVVETLKSRFGRDDLVVEYYIRELLGLVLQNAVSSKKNEASLASLYDKLGSHLRALESLGVATDKCAAMLFPLVESSLPEEALRAWQRSEQRNTTEATDSTDQPRKSRLTLLLKFLQNEVENEERIDMAKKGFNVTSPEDSRKHRAKQTEVSKEMATCSALLIQKNNKVKCIFCSEEHISEKCPSARKLSMSQRKAIIKREKACYNCLLPGHFTNKCRAKCVCEWCSGRHVLIVCPSAAIGGATGERHHDETGRVGHEKPLKEHNMTTFSQQPEVYLETLRAKLYSDSKEVVVRVILDSAS